MIANLANGVQYNMTISNKWALTGGNGGGGPISKGYPLYCGCFFHDTALVDKQEKNYIETSNIFFVCICLQLKSFFFNQMKFCHYIILYQTRDFRYICPSIRIVCAIFMDSQTVWTADFWLNSEFLILQN